MLKRSVLIALAVIYLATFLIGTYVYFTVEGSFSLGSRYFWAFTGLPAFVLLMHLAAGTLLLWRRDQAAPAALAVELFFLAAALVGAGLFWVTFRWILMLALVRAVLTGVAIYLVWWPPVRKDRPALIAGAGVGLILAVSWMMSLRPDPVGASPMITAPVAITLWERPPTAAAETDSRLWNKNEGLPLDGGAKVSIQSTPPCVMLHVGKSTVVIEPLLRLRSISTDGFAATKLNRLNMAFYSQAGAQDWIQESTGLRCAYVRCPPPPPVGSRIADSAAASLANKGVMAADFYTRVDPKNNEVGIVGLTYLRLPLYVNDSSLFVITAQPRANHSVFLPSFPNASPAADKMMVVNFQQSGARLYLAEAELDTPVVEQAQVQTFDDYFVIENLDGDQAVIVLAPDLRRQAYLAVSPGGGEPLACNLLAIGETVLPQNDPSRDVKALLVRGSVASAALGGQASVIRMKEGTYVNRMTLRVVKNKSNYADVAAQMRVAALPAAAQVDD